MLQNQRAKRAQRKSPTSETLSSDSRNDVKSAVNSLVIKKRLTEFQKKAFGFKNMEMVGSKLQHDTTMNQA